MPLTAGFGSVWSLPLLLDLDLTQEHKPGLRPVSQVWIKLNCSSTEPSLMKIYYLDRVKEVLLITEIA